MAKTASNIIRINTLDYLCVYFLSFFVAAWYLLKMCIQWLFKRDSYFKVVNRDNPPSFLVDGSLGQHKYVKLKRVKLHYVELGSKTQPLMLLLHGFPDCWLTWRYQIPFFAEYFRVVALDLKGFGDSDKPHWRAHYKLETILEELKQFILALGVSNCIVIGHDIGAILGWYLSNESPEFVEKFVSVSCSHPNVHWDNLPSGGIHSANWIKFAQISGLAEMDAMKNDIKIVKDYHSHLFEKDATDGQVLEAYKYSFSRKEDWTGPLNYFRILPFYRMDETRAFNRVTTLLITGNKDRIVNLESIVKSTDYCKEFFVKIIDNTGHYPHQEDPETFNKILIKFLKVKPAKTKQIVDKSPSKRLMDKMFGAVSSTVKYGNSVLDSVNKRTNGVMPNLPSNFGLNLNQSEDKK